jgi:predicted alpha/beta-hydrolase family hydrolase
MRFARCISIWCAVLAVGVPVGARAAQGKSFAQLLHAARQDLAKEKAAAMRPSKRSSTSKLKREPAKREPARSARAASSRRPEEPFELTERDLIELGLFDLPMGPRGSPHDHLIFAPRPKVTAERVKTFDLTQPGKPTATIVFFPGAGQAANNDLIQRVADALKAEGVSVVVHSLPTEEGRFDVEQYLAGLKGPVILAGHSMGGAQVFEDMLTRAEVDPKVSAAFLINPATPEVVRAASLVKVPTIVFRGTNDFPERAGRHAKNLRVVAVREGDHSLRFRAPWMHKSEADNTPETSALNREVAKLIGELVRDPQTALDKDVAMIDIGVTPPPPPKDYGRSPSRKDYGRLPPELL